MVFSRIFDSDTNALNKHQENIDNIVWPVAYIQEKRYKSFMGLEDSDEILSYFSRKNFPSIFGDKGFIDRIKETLFNSKANQEIPKYRFLVPNISRIISIVAELYNVDEQSLLVSRRGVGNKPGNVAVYLARYLRGEPLQPLELSLILPDTALSAAQSNV